MKKHNKILVWIVTFFFAVTLVVMIGTSIVKIQKQTEVTCFAYLDEATHRLADDLYKTADMDHTILTAMATIIAEEKEQSDPNLCQIMKNYDSVSSYVDYVEILRPDNTMLDSDGTVRDVSAFLDFEAEAKKGSYISDIAYSTKDSEQRVIRNAVPVVAHDGQTVFMLYGVVQLTDFAKTFTTNIYGGNAYVYLEDGATGEFLLDTWHNSFGNISDFYDRENISKDSFRDAAVNMGKGVEGDLAFTSRSTGDILYMHYEPVGINNWNVIVTVQDRYALENSKAISTIMYRMAGTVGIVVLFYMIFVITILLQAYHHIRDIGLNDQITGLQNRNAYDAFVSRNENCSYELVACIYVDVNGLHELNNREGHAAGDRMLRKVADALRAVFPASSIFRAGGDEFVTIAEGMDEDTCKSKAEQVNKILTEAGYSIACGVSVQQKTVGLSEIIKHADERMLENKKSYYAVHDRRMR